MNQLPNRLIALLEIVGGVFGAGIFVWSMFTSGNLNVLMFLLLGLYVLCVTAGVHLWRGRPSGLVLSIIVQALQILSYSSPRFTFRFVSAVAAYVGHGPAGWSITRQFGSSAQIAITTGFGPGLDDGPVLLGFNVLAAAILSYLVLQSFWADTALPPPCAPEPETRGN